MCLNHGSKLEICFGKSNTNEHKVSLTLYCHTPHLPKGEILITDATSTRHHTPYIPSDLAHHEKHPTEESKSNHISQLTDLYTRLLPRVLTSIESTKASCAQLPDMPRRSDTKSFALSRVFLLSSGGKSIVLVKKKASSRSAFPLSTHVVLKTRHVNPNIHVRRY